MSNILFFDTETTGLPKSWNAKESEVENWPRLVQLGWILADDSGKVIHEGNMIVRPNGFEIPEQASNVHGITTDIAVRDGKPIQNVIVDFSMDMAKSDAIVGHNILFDKKVVGANCIVLDLKACLTKCTISIVLIL